MTKKNKIMLGFGAGLILTGAAIALIYADKKNGYKVANKLKKAGKKFKGNLEDTASKLKDKYQDMSSSASNKAKQYSDKAQEVKM